MKNRCTYDRQRITRTGDKVSRTGDKVGKTELLPLRAPQRISEQAFNDHSKGARCNC